MSNILPQSVHYAAPPPGTTNISLWSYANLVLYNQWQHSCWRPINIAIQTQKGPTFHFKADPFQTFNQNKSDLRFLKKYI